jgi:pimeloyl-ACP methyl ester carboxylesterase
VHILVNGVKLYFDVEGAGLRPRGSVMQDMPTLLMLHGGPGVDHTIYKPAFSAAADFAQVVYLDHRGNGRSESGACESWTLAQWADDVKAFCDALGIVKPIVYGASFGGMVAMAYAIRHAEHPAKLVLVSTSAQATAYAHAKVATFRRLGGDLAGDLAHRRYIDGDSSDAVLSAWLKIAVPLYTRIPADPLALGRATLNRAATAWFNRVDGEGRSFDMLKELASIKCPTLVMGGIDDPMLPIACQRDIAAAIPPNLLTYKEFENCGHGVVPDLPELAFEVLREFVNA